MSLNAIVEPEPHADNAVSVTDPEPAGFSPDLAPFLDKYVDHVSTEVPIDNGCTLFGEPAAITVLSGICQPVDSIGAGHGIITADD